MRVDMPNLRGKTDREKIDILVKIITRILEEQNETKQEENILPVGTVILRKNTAINGGMKYGEWLLTGDEIKLSYGTLKAYIRTE